MGDGQAVEVPQGSRGSDDTGAESQCEKQRLYKREYMRRWRASPCRQSSERGRRRRAYYARKERELLTDASPDCDPDGPALCGYCGIRPSVEEVERLEIANDAPDGYVEVRIPYCGRC